MPVHMTHGRGREDMRKFWNNVNNCTRKFEEGSRVLLKILVEGLKTALWWEG